MDNREAFRGISAEPEESIEEVNWRQNSYNQRGRGYSNRGSNRGSYRSNHYWPSSAARGRGYSTYGNNKSGSNGYMKKTGTTGNPDVRCLICGLKGQKVATCRSWPEPKNQLGRIKRSTRRTRRNQGKEMHQLQQKAAHE